MVYVQKSTENRVKNNCEVNIWTTTTQVKAITLPVL